MPAPPRGFAGHSYLVCGTPRAGTSLLCGLLAGTGLAGRPEEYFWRDNQPDLSRRWGVAGAGFTDYLRAAIAQGTTPNGVFGAKVMFGYLPDGLARQVVADRDGWRRWFGAQRVEPLEVKYE